MDYKEGLHEIKIMIKNRLNHSLSSARIGRNNLINDFEDWLSCLLTKIHLVESEITKTQQECDHYLGFAYDFDKIVNIYKSGKMDLKEDNCEFFNYCPDCGLKLR